MNSQQWTAERALLVWLSAESWMVKWSLICKHIFVLDMKFHISTFELHTELLVHLVLNVAICIFQCFHFRFCDILAWCIHMYIVIYGIRKYFVQICEVRKIFYTRTATRTLYKYNTLFFLKFFLDCKKLPHLSSRSPDWVKQFYTQGLF